MVEKKLKRSVIRLSSSSDEEEEEEEEEENDRDDYDDDVEESEGDDSDDDAEESGRDDFDDDAEESGASTYSEGSEDEAMETDDDDDDDEDLDDDSICKRVIRLLREGRDIKELNLKECKVYLRKHGLRITGTKEVSIERVKEHWRIKDANGEVLYPKSSFFINCTGDVCKGDVVLFTQKVYAKFDKVKRIGKLLGKRTIAGRIVKESYGAAKQQHTFTVEVLWSKGIKKLPPLFPLLVKGRNLYKLKTFRQRWKNEAERLQVLAEKHKRGATARLVRAKRKAKRRLSSSGGDEYQKYFPHTKAPQVRGRTKSEKRKAVHEHGRRSTVIGHAKANDHNSQKGFPIGKASINSRASESSRHQRLSYPSKVGASNFYRSPMEVHRVNTPYQFPSHHDMDYNPNMTRLPPFRPYADSFAMPPSLHQGVNKSYYNTHHAYSNPSYEFETRNLNHFSAHTFSLGTGTYEGRKKGSHPSRR